MRLRLSTRGVRRGLLGILVVLVGLALVNLKFNFGVEIAGSGSGVVVRHGFIEFGWPRDVPEVAFTIRESSPRLPLMPRLSVFSRGDGSIGPLKYHQVAAPLWMLIAGVVLMLVAIKPKRARRAGMCTACGYDIARLAADLPCPECGGIGTKSA